LHRDDAFEESLMPAVADNLHPLKDPARMRVLASIDFDNATLRAELDRISQNTAQRTGLPVSLVTLILDTAQLVAGSTGLDGSWVITAGGTPIQWSFCASTVTTRQPYILPDTANSEQATNPLVTIDGIASYAGVPITIAGQVIGAHCIIGVTAQPFTDEQIEHLHAGAAQITTLFQRFSDLP
jgi:GAF domain-containing protein